MESQAPYRVPSLFQISVLTTTRSAEGGHAASTLFSELCVQLSARKGGIPKTAVAQTLNDCLALNHIREAMGWTGILFITSVPLDLYSDLRDAWDAIWEEYKRNKKTFDKIVIDRCPHWSRLIVGDLKRKIDETDRSVPDKGMLAVHNHPPPNNIAPNLTTQDRHSFLNLEYSSNVMDRLGEMVSSNRDPNSTKLFISAKVHNELRDAISKMKNRPVNDVYTLRFGQRFPPSTKTLYFFVHVHRETNHNERTEYRWVMVRFEFPQTIASVYDTAGSQDVFYGSVGKTNKKLVDDRLDLIFRLYGAEPNPVEVRFAIGPLHRTGRDSGPMVLERLKAEFHDEGGMTSDDILDPAAIQKVREYHSKMLGITGMGPSIKVVHETGRKIKRHRAGRPRTGEC